MRSRIHFGLAVISSAICILLGVNQSLSGQAFTGNLNGVLTDPTKSTIAGAAVRLTNTQTNESRTSKTADDGRYSFAQLLPGPYKLSIEAPGFKTFVQDGIVLAANQTSEVSVSLQVGATNERVEVTGEAPPLDTQTADEAINLTSRDVESLPLNTRTPFGLVLANGGFSEPFDFRNASQDQNYDRFGINGGRTESSAVVIDGVPDTAGSQWNGLIYSPTVDAVQEIQILSDSYDSQFGRSGGAVISMVTKGGSNQFHGAAFEFIRNSDLDATNYFTNKNGQSKPYFGRNQFGGSLGGPIWKSKRLFFFGSYEGLRQGTPDTRVASVPTLLQRQGDFSQTYNRDGSLQVIYNPFSTRPNATGTGYIRDPFPNNIIPATLFDPVGAKVLALYPAPNRAGNAFTASNNWFGTAKVISNTDRYDARIDWARTEKHTMYFVLGQAPRETTYYPAYAGWGAGETNTYQPNPRLHATYGNTFTPSPSWVFNILLGYGQWTEETIPEVRTPGTSVGLPQSLVSQFQAPGDFPQFQQSNYNTLGAYQTLNHPQSVRSLETNFTKELSAHSIKFGYSMSYIYENGPGAGGWVTAPQFYFDQNMTSGPNYVPGNVTSGNSLASLLLGTGSHGNTAYTAPLAESHHAYGLYLQDAWRVNQRLTLNLGLRYELQKPSTDRYNRYSSFSTSVISPLAAQTGLDLHGGLTYLQGGNLGRNPWDSQNLNFAPRVSLAYKLTDKLVLRTGYGIFFLPLLGIGSLEGYSSNTAWQSSVGGAGIVPLNLLSNPYPTGLSPVAGSSQGLLTDVGRGVPFQQRTYQNAYVQNYSFDLQYQLSHSSVLQVGYSGNQSRHLAFGGSININQLPTKYLSLGSQLNNQVTNPFYGTAGAQGFLAGPTVAAWRLLTPYPQFDAVSLIAPPAASASYNALLIKYTKHFTNGLSAVVNYQRSKAIDDSSETQAWEVGDNGPRDAYNWRLERSISAHDIPNSFAAAIVYDLPVGKGRMFGSSMNRYANAVVGGWQVSTLMNFQSGIPINMSAPGNGYGFAYQPPNISSFSAVPLSNPTVQRWFNTAAFSQPAPYTIGSAPRRITQLRQDGVHSADVSLTKSFAIFESLRLQFLAQFFNISNTPQFAAPNTFVGSNNFGQVTSTYNDARDIQFALKLTF